MYNPKKKAIRARWSNCGSNRCSKRVTTSRNGMREDERWLVKWSWTKNLEVFFETFLYSIRSKKKKKDRGILRTKSKFVSIVGIVVVHSSRFNTFKQSCMYIPRYVKFIHGLGRESVSDNSSAITREHRNVGWKCNNARRSNNEIGGRDIEAKDTTGEQN